MREPRRVQPNARVFQAAAESDRFTDDDLLQAGGSLIHTRHNGCSTTFAGRTCSQITLQAVADALLAARTTLARELATLEKRVRSTARHDDRVKLMMTAPGVGSIVGLTYVAAIDVPERFRSSSSLGPHFGMTPKKYQSGETDVTGRISKIGGEVGSGIKAFRKGLKEDDKEEEPDKPTQEQK